VDPRHDLAQLLTLQRDVGPELLPVAYRMAASGAPRARLLRRGLQRAGQLGAQLGLHLVPGLVLVDVFDHQPRSSRPPLLAPGCVVAMVYGGDSDAALEIPGEHAPAGVNVIVVWRPARPWHRLRAWWRELTWRSPL
jgi:hypothetical protein